nr:N-terminal acetyltransferase A complex auxiliary subunit NAA15-like isoform X2 [Physcomitrium patens]|eukprot:XP_024371729.1 N-terminal acetyltransferase A complex auxiliary subunit NAA15-like isoform X2 [Physcomitrella patens]
MENDVKSHVCWHVYGLLYRSDRDYREAIKCYRCALRIDSQNIQILRDLSLLQAQMRELPGFVETRRQLLTLKPSHRNNWIGFAIAHHVNHEPAMAVSILDAYEGTLEEDFPPESERYEHSEMLLYKATVLEEAGQPEKAFEELAKNEGKIVDKLGLREHKASLLLQINRSAEAEDIYRKLLDINPDNYLYYEGLQKCLGLTPNGKAYTSEQVEKLVELYDGLRRKYPRSAAAKRIPLDFLEEDSFKAAVTLYIRPFLKKGVPSLFTDLRPLYSHPRKDEILEEVFVEVVSSLQTSKTFPGSSDVEAPSTYLWTLCLLAQHFDKIRQYEKAYSYINQAIEHTPTVIDFYLVKGRILKHAGDPTAAAALANEARTMDLADRFLNSECVKRMLQADQVEIAEKTAVLFTRDGDQHNNLFDMQCMWYELASGDSHFRQGNMGKALKKYLLVEKHYNDMIEDQFDFHTYCLRKMTLRAYIRMLRFQDQLHSHRFFFRAATSIIRCYIKLHDSPPKTAVEEHEAALAGLPTAERKKMRQKLRKAEAKAKKEAEEKVKLEELAANAAANKAGKKGAQTPRPVDTDPDGDKLMNVEDPLSEALKYLRLLQEHSADAIETHLLAFEVYFRKNKKLLALQAVKKQLALDPSSPDVHRCLIRLFESLDKLRSPDTHAEKIIHDVIAIERASMQELGEKSLLDANRDFLATYRDSLQHRVAAAEIHLLLCPDAKSEAIKIIEESPERVASASNDAASEWFLKNCVEVHQLLENSFGDKAAATKWSARCGKLFPFSTYFKGAKCSAARLENIQDSNHSENGKVESECEKDHTHSVNGGVRDLVLS